MLEVRNLTRRFGDVTAVDDVSFSVPGGVMTGFVGGNGAGKTSTMRMIMGVLGITTGHVEWDGHEITSADRRSFGYMPEERGLYPKQRVIDQLAYLGRLKGMDAGAARRTVMDHLERFGLAERAKDRVQELSLGNQQRVQITAAVMADPAALILDEPFSGLDPAAVDAMADLLRDHTARGVPVLFSSHQLDLVERLCDRLVVLKGGRVLAEGTAADLQSRGPRLVRLVLDGDAGWVRDRPGVRVADLDRTTVVFEPADADAADAVLRDALHRGRVEAFAPVIPSLNDVYLEMTK